MGLDRLLLAARKGEGLVYVGGCGPGWTYQESLKLRELLDAIRTDQRRWRSNARPRSSLSRYLSPRPSIAHGRLRHPSFKGIREREVMQRFCDVLSARRGRCLASRRQST